METSDVASIAAVVVTMFIGYLTYRASKNATRVGLEANAFQRAVKAEEQSQVAKDKSEEAERRADAVIVRMRKMEASMVGLESRLRYIILLIHDPYISIEMLRERVPLNFNTARRDDE